MRNPLRSLPSLLSILDNVTDYVCEHVVSFVGIQAGLVLLAVIAAGASAVPPMPAQPWVVICWVFVAMLPSMFVACCFLWSIATAFATPVDDYDQ